ncbi:MAG: DUF4390 domain-containing protein [Gammaproteobacteria bacterium]|nr:DUF4390 domain-containing protein [Gammaproteobacteria bacterium]
MHGTIGHYRHLTALLTLCLTLAATTALAAEFRVREVRSQLVDGVYRMDADLDLELEGEVRDALVNGVPLILGVEIEVVQQRPWLWDQTVASLEQRYQLRHHALSRRYLVKNLNTGVQTSHTHLEDALASVERIRGLPLLEQPLLMAGDEYRGRVRVRLHTEALPSPLRPMAYLSRDWRLKSEWVEWPLQPGHAP